MNTKKVRTWSSYVEALRMAVAILLSLAIVFVIILLTSKMPLQCIHDFVLGPLTSLRRFGNVIESMTPLMFTGLAVIVLFRPGLFNLSMEGAFFMGAVAACGSALTFDLPPVVNLIVALAAAAVAGALICFIPGVLQAKCHANELVTSLMLNYICKFVGLFIITSYFYDPTQNSNYSFKFPKSILLPGILPGTRVNLGTIFALAAVVIVWILLSKTAFGYKTRLVGQNHHMASYSGINCAKVIITSQIVGGILAGLGGGVELFGMYKRFQYSELPGFGWDGVLIAIVARNKPQFVPFAALFLAYLRTGADIMSRNGDVPYEIVKIIQAVMVLLISATAILSGLKKNLIIKETRALEAQGEGK